MVQKYEKVYSAKTYSQTTPIQPILTQTRSIKTFISYFFFFFFFFLQEQLIPECPATRVKIRATLGWSHIWDGTQRPNVGILSVRRSLR